MSISTSLAVDYMSAKHPGTVINPMIVFSCVISDDVFFDSGKPYKNGST
ncbi:MAG: hypothetical protein WBN49_13830 [Arenicellales bacterium]|jgi:hypothetical protein